MHKQEKDSKSEITELQSVNRELRKIIRDLRETRDSWKGKLSDKQYELKIQKNTSLAARESRDRWQNKYMQKEDELMKIILEKEENQNEIQVQLDIQKEVNEGLKKELEEKKTLY